MSEPRRKTASELDISIRCLGGEWKMLLPQYRSLVRRWCKAAIGADKSGELAVVLADDAFLHSLNHTYRQKNKATNVLSFPGSNGEIGDIILAQETIAAEAQAQGKHFLQHTAHLVVHGCLHLLGYDHETPSEADEMEAHEIAILASLGFPNPYKVA